MNSVARALISLGPLGPWVRRLVLLSAQGFWPRVIGMRRVPRRGPLVIAAGHFSGIDSVLLACAIPRAHGLVLSEQFLHLPVSGKVRRILGGYPIRDVPIGFDESNVASLEAAAAAVRGGDAVGIYPQGLRLDVGGGVARLAAMAQAPVLPVFFYFSRSPRAKPRALLIVRRPVPPPAPDARSRRAFRKRFTRRLHVMGGLRPDDDTRGIVDVVLDDARLWRKPLAVPRAAARINRLEPAVRRRLARHARALHRGCHLLRCSVGDLRRPPGPGAFVLYALLVLPAAWSLLINGPPWTYLRVVMRKIKDPANRRSARLVGAAPISMMWGALLTIVGLAAWGWAGLLLPLSAAVGAACMGPARVTRRRMIAALRIRHGRRLRHHLAAFEPK